MEEEHANLMRKARKRIILERRLKRFMTGLWLATVGVAIVLAYNSAPAKPQAAVAVTVDSQPQPHKEANPTATAAESVAVVSNVVSPPEIVQPTTTTTLLRPTTTTPAIVKVRGVSTCANPNQDKISFINNYVGPMSPDQIKKLACGG